MQAAAQKPSVAGALRAAYHSMHPPDTVVFKWDERVLDLLGELNIPYREYREAGLVTAPMDQLLAKVPELQEFLSQQKAAAEAQHRRLTQTVSSRNRPISNKNNERVSNVGGGVLYNTSSTTGVSRDIMSGLQANPRFKQLVSTRSARVTTSIKVRPELWAKFKQVVVSQGLSLSEVLEELIALYLREYERVVSDTTGSME